VLVVDDRAETRHVLTRVLGVQGYEAACVASGLEALEFIRKRKPSLIILDYEMPELDGLSVFRKMKSDPGSRDIPTIVFSASDGPIKRQAVAEGVKAWIMKGSLDLAELLREVARHIGPGRPVAGPQVPPTRSNFAG